MIKLTKKLKTIGPDILNDASLTFEVYKKIMRKHNKKNIWQLKNFLSFHIIMKMRMMT